MRTPYTNLWERIVAGVHEPENDAGCWLWKHRVDRYGYGIFDFYVPGLGRNATIKTHIASFCWLESNAQSADDLYLAYLEHKHSGLELDHGCVIASCCRPCCLTPVTPSRNMELCHERRQRRALARQ